MFQGAIAVADGCDRHLARGDGGHAALQEGDEGKHVAGTSTAEGFPKFRRDECKQLWVELDEAVLHAIAHPHGEWFDIAFREPRFAGFGKAQLLRRRTRAPRLFVSTALTALPLGDS